jgi:hypothetical protein
MNMKKSIFIFVITLSVLFLFACSKSKSNEDNNADSGLEGNTATLTPIPTNEPTIAPTGEAAEAASHEGEMRSYLTGLWVPEDIGQKRPIAFVFNNFKSVSNQSGIEEADIVYEALVEGGITRLLGIGEHYTGDRIGSSRSARHYFVSVADEYDAIYIHYGETKYAAAKFDELGVDDIDGTSGIGDTVFYRDKSIKPPHNAFASSEGILKGIEKKGFETKYSEGYQPHFSFYEKDTDLISGTAVNKITLDFSSYTEPYFEYNSKDKLYYRFQFGGPHIDTVTGNQLAFKNLIVQFVKEWNIDKNGYQTMDFADASGKGYYITNGKMIPITWKKKEADSFMRYYNEAGEELTINPGKTFVTLFPNNRTEDVVIK